MPLCNDDTNRVVVMKLYIKRISSSGNELFMILDELGTLKYTVSAISERMKQRIIISDTSGNAVSEIIHKEFVMRYFTVRCRKGFYVLLPYMKRCFYFKIYGSTYRFAGDMTSGRFSLFDVDKSPVMTQKKCWTSFGEGYEIELYIPEQEHFALSCAVCADLYLSAAEEKPVLSG